MKLTCLMPILVGTFTVSSFSTYAQDAEAEKQQRYNNYYLVDRHTPGTTKETVHTFYEGHEYLYELANGKLDELHVDTVLIPAQNYASYQDVIKSIQTQIAKDQIEERRSQLQKENQLTTHVIAQSDRSENRKSERRFDEEQVRTSQVLTITNVEKVDPDRQMMRTMIDDLIRDGLINNDQELLSLTLSTTEMTVNGRKQPDAIFNRYKKKYNTWASGNFSYGGNQQQYEGIHLRRFDD